MPVVAFTGTSTGSVYKVGQSYSSAGRTYTAQADGSFKTTNKDGSVRSVVGSSQSESATFYVSKSLASGGGGSAKGGAVKGAGAASVTGSRPGSVPYTGKGPGSLPRLQAAATMGGANPRDFVGQFFARSPKPLPGDGPGKVTVPQVLGFDWPANPYTSDYDTIAKRTGDDFPGGMIASLIVLGSDALWAVEGVKRSTSKALNDAVTWGGVVPSPGIPSPFASDGDPYGFANPRFGQ